MTSIGDVDLRSIVKVCVALEKSPTETMKMINSTGKYKKNAVRLQCIDGMFVLKKEETRSRTILDSVGSLLLHVQLRTR